MKKFLFLGTKVAPYHGSAGIDEQVARLLKNEWEMVYSEDLSLLTKETLKQFDMVISYLEFSRERIATDEQTEALIDFVESGKVLMAFHNGIALQNRDELRDLIGAKFTGHPYYEAMPILDFHTVLEHPITKGVTAYSAPDEAYMFEMVESAEKTLFLAYDYEGQTYPAGWFRSVGKGKVIYFAAGHCRCAFFSDLSKMIVNAAAWASSAE